MKMFSYGLFALCASLSLPASAQIISDDVIVDKKLCVGTDCVNGETFTQGSLKLKENNLRIRWIDSSATNTNVRQTLTTAYIDGAVGQSWRMEANQSVNSGLNAFYIDRQSVEEYPVLSNGSAPDYDCSDPFVTPTPIIGTIPAGSPAEGTNCQALNQTLQLDSIILGGTSSDGVALGNRSELKAGQVSLGNAEVRRRLAHVASALADSDVLIKSQLDMGVFAAQIQRMDEIEALLDSSESEIAFLEAAITPKKSSRGGIGSVGGFVLLIALVAFGRMILTSRVRPE